MRATARRGTHLGGIVVGAMGAALLVGAASCTSGGAPTHDASPVATPISTAVATETTPAEATGAAPDSATTPRARAYAVMTDIPGKGVLLLGGQFGTPPGTPLSDLWSFAPDRGWTEIAAETGRGSDAIAYDSQSELVVLAEESGTWAYDPITDEWREVEARGPAFLGWGSRMAFDAGSDRMILFGGYDEIGTDEAQTWALNVANGEWTRMRPETNPAGRNFHAMAYDPKSDRVIVFGGTAGPSSMFGDTWAYDYDTDTWTELAGKGGPEPRNYSAMVYDPVGQRMILFGGITGAFEDPLGDTWAFDTRANTWTELSPPTSPSARGWHSMAFDAETGAIVLFSGGETRDTDLADTWIFDPNTDTWSQVG